ncbi:cordon-bleu protein-like 1 isoform X3 [Microtus pennsylvanicus]|uniref:cordon-bleu protein-like 1 isoform X3 n=1 Tax=Microtus pennsylvanicus TaxID=10058 RepID=UPI003F6B1EB8
MGQAVTRRLQARARAASSSAMDRSALDPGPRSAPRTPAPQPAGSVGRKPKAKAPLPPAEMKGMGVSSSEEPGESTAVIAERNENMVDKDIDLSVVLPGDILKSTTVPGSKPMMDLLVFLCAQYHLNPSSHTIDLLSAEENLIKYKPNTPIGMLEVEKVILKPKSLDKKKPTPIIPEKTVRVVINFKKTQKTIVRVSPHAPLQDLAPIICSKCEFDPLHTVLLKDYQAQEPLDLTKSLNDLGLRELYAMDISRESCQVLQTPDIVKEKENRGIFSFFQRSKKKREQTASAPATPLVSKHRPSFTRSNTISKPYISNTLPSDAPKKRRAPLPPMPTSQGVVQGQERRASCVVRSTSVDDADKSSTDGVMVRTGSLQLSSSSGTLSLKRTKRKAPAPPSKTPLQNDDSSLASDNALLSEDGVAPDSALEADSPEVLSSPDGSPGPRFLSQEQCTVPKPADELSLSEGPGTPEAAVASLTSGVSSDYSLEEIDEKEELGESSKDQAGSGSVKLPDVPSESTDRTNVLENDPDSALSLSDGEASPSSKGQSQEGRNTEGKGPNNPVIYDMNNEDTVSVRIRDLKTLESSQEHVVQNEIMVCATNTDHVKDRLRKTETAVEGKAPEKAVDVETSGLSGSPVCRTDYAAPSGPSPKMNQPSVEKTKMQDAAIQATPACSSFDGNHADHNLSDLKVDESVQTSTSSRSTQHSSSSLPGSVNASKAPRSPSTPTHVQERLPMKEPACASGNDGPLSPVDGSDKIPAALYQKNSPLYRQDYSPKPKPSNEITREYIPKIGMTTYKIVPPKSLELVKAWESETLEDKDGQKMHAAGQKHVLENTKETAMQTEEVLATSRGSQEPQPDLKPKPSPGTERPLQRTLSSPTGAENPPKPPRVTMDTGGVPFAPNLEDINNILESKFRSRASNPQAKPSSFFLQMQKRASGHYVTSAAAKSVHTAPGPTPKEPATKEVQRDSRPPPEQILSPLSERTHSAPLSNISKTDGIIQKPAEISLPPVAPKPVASPAEISLPPVAPKPVAPPPEISPPPVAPKPVALPPEISPPPVAPKPMALPPETSLPPVAPKPLGGQGTSLNLKTLKTFGAPRPYSSSGPSPFALAVVKRSQSFSKARPESPSEDCSAQPAANREGEKTHTVNTPAVVPQHDDVEKKNKPVPNEQSSQMLTPADGPSLTLKRQSSLTFQSSDPEQVRQSLLTAIRSGEAASKLKRVTVPSNTIAVNGKSGLSHAVSSDAQDSG